MTGKPPKADATTWVARDKNGDFQRIKVVDMEDDHLFRWIRYFRQKYDGPGLTGDRLDAFIQAQIITAPAIYAEAVKRGVLSQAWMPSSAPTKARPTGPEPAPGQRRITLEEDD